MTNINFLLYEANKVPGTYFYVLRNMAAANYIVESMLPSLKPYSARVRRTDRTIILDNSSIQIIDGAFSDWTQCLLGVPYIKGIIFGFYPSLETFYKITNYVKYDGAFMVVNPMPRP